MPLPDRLRQAVNAATLVSPAGLLLARAGGARTVTQGPRGTVVLSGYRLPVPAAPAFTVGDVVVLRTGCEHLVARPALLRHEAAHSDQWAACGGWPFLLLYAAASAWSWWRTGDPATANVFERRAGLADGGYLLRTTVAR